MNYFIRWVMITGKVPIAKAQARVYFIRDLRTIVETRKVVRGLQLRNHEEEKEG